MYISESGGIIRNLGELLGAVGESGERWENLDIPIGTFVRRIWGALGNLTGSLNEL